MWNALLDAGTEFGIRPCGLGARNTPPRSRHEPLRPRNLRGHQRPRSRPRPLAQIRQRRFSWKRGVASGAGIRRPKAQIIGLEMIDRGIARMAIRYSISKGTRSAQSLGQSRAVPQVQTSPCLSCHCPLRSPAQTSSVDVRGNRARAKQVPLPFYSAPRNKPLENASYFKSEAEERRSQPRPRAPR